MPGEIPNPVNRIDIPHIQILRNNKLRSAWPLDPSFPDPTLLGYGRVIGLRAPSIVERVRLEEPTLLVSSLTVGGPSPNLLQREFRVGVASAEPVRQACESRRRGGKGGVSVLKVVTCHRLLSAGPEAGKAWLVGAHLLGVLADGLAFPVRAFDAVSHASIDSAVPAHW